MCTRVNNSVHAIVQYAKHKRGLEQTAQQWSQWRRWLRALERAGARGKCSHEEVKHRKRGGTRRKRGRFWLPSKKIKMKNGNNKHTERTNYCSIPSARFCTQQQACDRPMAYRSRSSGDKAGESQKTIKRDEHSCRSPLVSRGEREKHNLYVSHVRFKTNNMQKMSIKQ